MYDESVRLIEMPEHQSISVCVYNENDGIFELSQRINEQVEEAYMNGYNWDAVIRFYVGQVDPELMEEVDTDPESGMFSAYMPYSEDNLKKMKRFEAHIRKLLSDEAELMRFIRENRESIEWD